MVLNCNAPHLFLVAPSPFAMLIKLWVSPVLCHVLLVVYLSACFCFVLCWFIMAESLYVVLILCGVVFSVNYCNLPEYFPAFSIVLPVLLFALISVLSVLF